MVTNKRRGYEVEREVVKLWEGLGVPVKRVLASGAFKHFGKDLAGDVKLNGLRVEVKRRKNGTGFASLYNWFKQDDADILVVRADKMPRLYVIPEVLMVKFAKDMGWVQPITKTETEIEGEKDE
tara:strand:- start:365 stop:736 length:372 start_codon:yes stop_codon:yes gene_type:complete